MKPKTLFFSSLVAAAAMSTVPALADAETIKISYGYGSTESSSKSDSGNGTIDFDESDGWNNATNKSNSTDAASILLKNSTGTATTATTTWTSANTWQWTGASGASDEVLQGYLDDGTSVTITVSNISYLVYDVTVIASTDTNNVKFSAKTLNGNTYTSDGNGTGVLGSGTWGNTSTKTVGNDNSFTVSGLTGDLSLSSVKNDTARGCVAGLIITNATPENIKARAATLDGTDSPWTTSSLAGTTWENSTADAPQYANLTMSADTTLTLESGVITDAVWTHGSGALTLSGAELEFIGLRILRADKGTSIVVNNTLKFTEGGTLSGTITTGDSGSIVVKSGTMNAAALTGSGLNFSVESGATVNFGSVAGISQNLTGEGAVSFNSTSHGATINLGTDFKGTVNISGSVGLDNHKFGANTATVSVTGTTHFWSPTTGAQEITQALNFESGTATRVGGWGSKTTTLTISGNMTFEDGATFTVDASPYGTAIPVDISGVVTNGNFTLNSGDNPGTLTFSGEKTKAITTLTQTAGVLNISGTGTNSIGTLTLSGGTANITAGTNTITTLTQTGGALNVSGTTDENTTSTTITTATVSGGTISGGNITTANVTGGTVAVSGATVGTAIVSGSAALNLSGTNTFTNLRQGAGTINISGTTTATNLVLSHLNAAGTLNVNSGAVLLITGDSNSTEGSAGSFMIGNYNQTNTVNVNGVLNLKAAGITTRDGNGDIYVKSGAEMNFNAGLTVADHGNNAGVIRLHLQDGGRINIGGTAGISNSSILTLDLAGGTIGSLVDSWSTSRSLTLGGGVTIDTTKKTFNETGSATDAGTGSAITLSGGLTFSGDDSSLVISGNGSVTLGGTVSGATVGTDADAKITVNSGSTLKLNASSLVYALTGDDESINGKTLNIATGEGTISTTGTLSRTNFTWNGFALSGRTEVSALSNGSVTFTGTAYNLFWKGGNSGTWNTTEGNTIWGDKDGAATAFVAGDNVTFNTSGAVAVSVDSSGVTAGTMTVSAGDVTLSGGNVTANTANITAGTLTISSNSKLTTIGGITVSDSGTLKISSKTNIGGDVTVGSGGTFDLNGAAGDIGANGLGTVTLAGGKLVNNGTSVTTDMQQLYALTVTADSKIGGTGNFGLVGSGHGATTLNLGTNTLTKKGENTFWLVNTTISGNGGTLEATAGTLGGRSGYSITLGEGVTLKTSGTAGTSDLAISSMGANSNLTLAGTGAGTVTISGNVGTSSGNATINISNGSTVTYTNTANQALNANLTISGEGSMFTVSSENGTDHLNYSGTTAITVKNGGTLALGSNRWTFMGNNSLSLDGGNITGTSQSSQYGNLDFFSAKTISVGNTTDKESNISASIRLRSALTLDVAADTVLNITGKITNGNDNGKIIKTGSGTLTLDITSTATLSENFTGGVTVNEGKVVVKHASALGTGKVSVESGALGLVAGTTVSGVTNGVELASGAKLVIDMTGQTAETAGGEMLTLKLVVGSALKYNGNAFNTDCTTLITEGVVVLENLDASLTSWVKSLAYASETQTLTLTLTIPEPSTFGLLAGVGALALVAARRRRRAK